MHGQQNDKYTEMHGQQNDKYTEMHGQQNDKYTEMHGQQNVKIRPQTQTIYNIYCFHGKTSFAKAPQVFDYTYIIFLVATLLISSKLMPG